MFLVIRQQRAVCAMLQTRGYGLGVIVFPARKFPAATTVANAFLLGLLEPIVVTGAAVCTTEPAGNAVDQDSVVDFHLNHVVEAHVHLRKHLIKRFRLSDGAGKAIKMNPFSQSGCWIRSRIMAIMISSETSSPRSMIALAC